MNYILEPLTISALTNMEAGQLMIRHQNDLNTIDPALRTDVPYNSYMERIGIKTELYFAALAQVQKNEETEKILLADKARDKAVSSFNLALKLHASAEDPTEVEASRSLRILFDTFKNIAKLNYEAESLAIDKLVNDLNSEAYSEKIAYLHMNKYVTRLSETNDIFKNLFGGRMVGTAMTESYDMKTIRKEMQVLYTDFVEYVFAMAKATESQLFITALNLLNAARKYYNDQMLSKSAPKPETPVD
ncbi:MAG: hypothetical protein IPF54_21305 [Draconibacterium sp.]|nr:hypothetical protein [Draconibacterium sp.]